MRSSKTVAREGHARHVRRAILTFVALAGGLSASLLATGDAYGIVGCRGDPLVTLSNGVSVRLVANIGADPSRVTNLSYTLHVPRGLSVVSVWYDGGLPETLNWVADKPAVDGNGNAQFTDNVVISMYGKVQATISATTSNGAVENFTQANGSSDKTITQDFQYQPSADSTCSGNETLTGNIARNLIIPQGIVCAVSGMTVGGAVQIQPGGELDAQSLTVAQGLTVQAGSDPSKSSLLNASNLQVGKDLQTSAGATVLLSGATVSGNLNLQGPDGSSQLCGVSITNNATVSDIPSGSSLIFGDPSDGCGANSVGANTQIQKNAGSVTIGGNQLANLTCEKNTNLSMYGNRVNGQAHC